MLYISVMLHKNVTVLNGCVLARSCVGFLLLWLLCVCVRVSVRVCACERACVCERVREGWCVRAVFVVLFFKWTFVHLDVCSIQCRDLLPKGENVAS
jgi:hypothetical protein